MIKIEAASLESAYAKAAEKLECSVTELDVEIVQSPKKGFLNFFKKSAVIIATCKQGKKTAPAQETPATIKTPITNEAAPAIKTPLEEENLSVQSDEAAIEEIKEAQKAHETHGASIKADDRAVEHFFDEQLSDANIVEEVRTKINDLFERICFNINPVAVSLYDDATLLIEFSGEDAALLIGKEGYRYKALSYMLFNWINATYHMQLRLEIAEFLKNQEESIDRYLAGVYENIDRDGRAQTKVLDGVLVQIALRELRAHYPNKYVAIRSTRDGAKFVIINDYNEF